MRQSIKQGGTAEAEAFVLQRAKAFLSYWLIFPELFI
jgi:predicted secreted acid phosphatase